MDELTIAFKIESPPSWLPIGRTAENNWRTVEIDCSYWFNMNANGEVVLMYKPSCGMSPYPLLTERDGDNIVWRPKSGELVEGVGRLQAFFEVGTDVIGSSDMISCEVDSSLLGVDPGTDPGQTDLPWALDIIEQIAELSGHYPKIENGVLYVWDSEQEDWVQFQGGGGNPNAVLYTEQTLTGAQQEQARGNIGAGTYSKPSGGIPDSDIASAATWNAKGTYSKPSGGIPASDLASGVIPFEIPFVKQSDESWVFDPNSTLTSEEIFDGIKNAQGRGGVVAKVTTSNGGVLFYRALDALAEDGEPEDDPAALAEFIEFPFGDNYYYLHYIQVNPYSPDSDYWIETETERMDFVQSTYVDNRIESALASTQTYFVRGIASAARLLTSSGTSVSYADLVNAQKGNNNVEITAAMFDLDYNARFKISELLFDSQAGKSTVVLTDVTATKVVVATLTGTGETGALTGTVTTTSIEPELPSVTASDNGKFLRVVNGAWAAETVQTYQGGSY